jgi:hypothetical protein
LSATVGCDLSSRRLDLVKLDDLNVATHLPVELERDRRATSWERTLALPELMPPSSWWEDVYLVCIEAPYGAGTGTVAVLNRVVGALAARLPPLLRVPERCWLVRPDEWKRGLGLRVDGKPSPEDLERLPLILWSNREPPRTQDARDALCLAYYARELNMEAVRRSA